MESSKGWRLLGRPVFLAQISQLEKALKVLAAKDPQGYKSHPSARMLAAIRYVVKEVIPRDPHSAAFRQGNMLGPANRHWFRAKFHRRYRLFFRFSSELKVIVYAWVNDEQTLRKAGAKTDPYAVFRAMLDAGDPPASFAELLRTAKDIQLE